MKGRAVIFALLIQTVSVGCLRDGPEDRFSKGMEWLYEGRYEDAESHFLALSREYSREGSPEAREWRARALYQAGRIEHLYLAQPRRAVARLREALKIDPEAEFAFDALQEIAFIFYDRIRDYRTAALEFERLVSAFPEAKGVERFQYRIAQSYFMLREFNQARTEARILLENHKTGPIAADSMLLVANSYYVEGRYQEAVDAHRRLLQIRPDVEIESRSRFELGMCYQELGDYQQAERSYLLAIKSHPRPDLVKVQLDSLQKQMREESGEGDEKSPYSKATVRTKPPVETKAKPKPSPPPKDKPKPKPNPPPLVDGKGAEKRAGAGVSPKPAEDKTEKAPAEKEKTKSPIKPTVEPVKDPTPSKEGAKPADKKPEPASETEKKEGA